MLVHRIGLVRRVLDVLRSPTFIGAYLAGWWTLGVAFLVLLHWLDGSSSHQPGVKSGDPSPGGMSPSLAQVVMVFLGALGAILGCTMDFIAHKRLTPRSFFLRPAVGSLMALFIYFAMRSGVFALSGDPAPNGGSETKITNANLFFFFAVMAGLFSRAAYSKLEQMSLTLFSVDENDVEPVPLPLRDGAATPDRSNHDRTIVCRLATSDAERVQAFRLRYRVLVEEEGWQVESQSTPNGKIVTDALDPLSLVAVVPWTDRGIAATVRTTPLDAVQARQPDYLAKLIPLSNESLKAKLGAVPLAACSYTSRFVVRHRHALVHYNVFGEPPERHSIATAIASFMYCEGIKLGIEVDFIRCFGDERRFYARLGYRTLLPEVETIGWRPGGMKRKATLMYLNTLDRRHLDEIHSPFARYTPRDRQDDADRINVSFD